MAVTDVPNYEDFLHIGSDHLQMAWGQVTGLLCNGMGPQTVSPSR